MTAVVQVGDVVMVKVVQDKWLDNATHKDVEKALETKTYQGVCCRGRRGAGKAPITKTHQCSRH